MAKEIYLKSILRFLVVITVIITSGSSQNLEGGNFASFEKVLKYHSIFPQIIDPFPPKEKTLCLVSSHPFWNGHFLDATKKLRKIKKDDEAGLINGTLLLFHRYETNDLQKPAIMTFNWYYDKALEFKAHDELKKSYVKRIKNIHNTANAGGKDLRLLNTQIGNTDLEIAINGYITINGDLVFANKDLVTTNQRESKNWDLSIEQTQRFNIMGNVGDRFFIDIKQDSEADFTWENDLKIEYRGKENEILQTAEAGNINLNLAGMDAINMGGNNSSLFGIRAVSQFGPIEMQSVIAREQVKKSEQKMTGGMSTGEPVRIKEYDFIVDRYFFIDNEFKNNYYPLTANNSHIIDPNYVIGNYEVYQFGVSDGNPIYATAYLDPTDIESNSVSGNWKRLEENTDYELNRLYGYLRVNSGSAQNAIAIAYTITNYDPDNQSFGENHTDMGTNFKQEYLDCHDEVTGYENCQDIVKLKLIKGINKSTPSSDTWPLMFKNVYSLGGYDINTEELEIEIVQNLGAGLEETHGENGKSYLTIFGLDKENQSYQDVPDGKIDLYESLINIDYGELMLPYHMPFAYDTIPRTSAIGDTLYNLEFPQEYTYWGNSDEDLQDILVALDDSNGDFGDNDIGPAMYFDNNNDNIKDEHEFLIKIKTSTRSSSMDLGGFMIVEGSETVRLGSQTLQKDIDYTIDYFSGQINFLNSDALDPSAEISVSYEENQIISFDQKFLMGTYMKYGFGQNNYLAGGMFYYNQSIAEEKVDIGYEPMRNFAWNVSGKYQGEIDFLTKAVDFLPLINTNKVSKFNIEGNYAEIIPNPNPLGQAFIDDFEASKKISSISIMQRQWKMASPPDSTSKDSLLTIKNRRKMYWYNPYEDEPTQNIWPELSTSSQANNNTTKILELELDSSSTIVNDENGSYWNGIMAPMYSSEYNQSQSKYLDIWLNANGVQDDELMIHVDIGHISEDWNDNQILDTEDEPVYGPGMGDGILSDGEDIGVDKCTDSYEDGFGGCLCSAYDNAYYESDLSGIYNHETEYCIDPNAVTFSEALLDLNQYEVNPNADVNDPNGDDWCYNVSGCPTDEYSQINGTEGNGQAMGYRYPDTEDMDNNKTLDIRNDYFTISFNPKDTVMMVTQTIKSDGDSTGWKLFRMPLRSFNPIGSISDWEDVRSFRLRMVSNDLDNLQHLKIAKIELVENEWKKIGIAHKSDLNALDNENEYFSVEVINTDESLEYKNSLYFLDDIIIEHDEYNDIDMKEQSLVLSFVEDKDNVDESGLLPNHAALIKNTFDVLSSDQSLSYFAYEKMKMYVHGGDPESDNCSWCDYNDSEVDLLFRFGKDSDDDYYEIRQPIYEGWDNRNHLDINIDKLTQLKIPVINSPAEILNDIGLDRTSNDFENGCVGFLDDFPFGSGLSKTYDSILDSLNNGSTSFYTFMFNVSENDEIIEEGEVNFILDEDTFMICGEDWWIEHCIHCSKEDPNGDNYALSVSHESPLFRNTSLILENHPSLPSLRTEGNNQFDSEEINGIIYAEPAIEDFDGNDIYSAHPNYDYENDLYVWNNIGHENDLKDACNTCSELRIKGAPSINNIQNIIMGVMNNSMEKINGKVLVNELRMTGIKKSKEASFNMSASLDFADLMTISGDYKHKDSGFHKLQQRLGTGSSNESYSTTIKLHPNILLPHNWGIKTPMTLYYSNSISTPKYHPGSDILTDANDAEYDIKEIQSRDEKYSFSSSFNKSTRSTNWLIKRTIDNISLNYSAIRTNKSDNQIKEQIKEDYQVSGNYSYNWGKENYFSPFKFMKDWVLIGNILGQARYYYTPEKFSTSIQLSESDKETIQRSSPLISTNTYSFNMQRKFILNHKFTKTLSTTYTRQIDSNLEELKKDKWLIIKNMDPGRIEGISEKFSNTFAPDFLDWLNPNLTFNQTYTWNSNNNGETANIKSSPTFKTKVGLNIKDFIELIYTPENQSRSSRGRGRSRTTSSKKTNKINIKNPIARSVLGKFHSFASNIKSISSTYTYSTSHSYDNVSMNLNPSFLYKFGVHEYPVDDSNSLSDSTLIDNNLVMTSSHSYSSDIRTNTSINITKSIIASIDHKYAESLSIPSTSSMTENKSYSYYPIGNRGDEGFPMINWSINWSKIEKLWILDRYFKTASLSHGFTGEQSMSYSNSELQNEEYKLHYSPIIGFNGATKGHNPITLIANYNLTQTIKNIDASTERNHNNHINLSLKFKKTGGFKIDTFFFRDFYMRNNLDFAIEFDYNIDRKLMTSSRVSSLDDFNEQSKNTTWSLKPNVSYSFTRWITGNFYFLYGITESKTSGRNEERDFGFNMNIKIQG